MVHEKILPIGRGTLLRWNGKNPTRIEINPTLPRLTTYRDEILVILGEILAPLNHLGIVSTRGIILQIPPKTPYMIINTSHQEITMIEPDVLDLGPILYDPYRFQGQAHNLLDPADFIAKYALSPNFHSILPKWYSIKFSYDTHNLIFLHPELGLSFQTHTQREEYWEILLGYPIVVENGRVNYDVSPGKKFTIPLGGIHSIINPSISDWVLLREEYKGKFDERDITRQFYPNDIS